MKQARLQNGALVVDLAEANPGRKVAWATNFSVEWMMADQAETGFKSADESFVIFSSEGGVLEGALGSTSAPPYSIVLAPAGVYALRGGGGSPVVVLSTDRSDLQPPDGPRDARVAPIGAPFKRRQGLDRPQVFRIQDIPFPPGNARLKFLQSTTMSLNLVVYEGSRDRTALSPHSHTDFEQCTLAIEGDYVHHMRVPWGPNADAWQEDVHLAVSEGAALVIPPHLIHTTEGVGAGRHFLMDIFAPPRRDFIAKGWVANAADYAEA